jgi:hypothetical protein
MAWPFIVGEDNALEKLAAISSLNSRAQNVRLSNVVMFIEH